MPPLLPEQALEQVLSAARPGEPETRALEAAGGRVLAGPVRAGRDLPPFTQSAMDGYALASGGGAAAGARFALTGVSRAGGEPPGALLPGQAMRIFTGAPVPEGTTCVAMQEIVALCGDGLELREPVPAGRHVRPAGGDVPAGAEALPAGAQLTPPAMALLRALGVEFVSVHRAPRVALVASGDELCEDPAALRPGCVLESTSTAIRAALRAEGLELGSLRIARDTGPAHARALGVALEESDVLLVTGGVSVGDFDLVRPTLKQLGVEQVFWCVNQVPGGPLFFGRHGARLVFGIPGNPASTLVCWYQYALPAVRRMLGLANPRLQRLRARLERDFRKVPGKQQFARARLHWADGTLMVNPDPQQDSHTLRPFAVAQALAVFEAGRATFAAGEQIECDLLPGAVPDPDPRGAGA